MPREHARILCRIWSDDEFRALPDDAQKMYVLLLSQANLNYAGVIQMTVKRWAACSSTTTPESVLRSLEVLEDARFVVVDHDTEELLVRSFIRNDGVTKLPNVFKGALKAARQVQSPAIRHALSVELKRTGRGDAMDVAFDIDPGEGPARVRNETPARMDVLFNSDEMSIESEKPAGLGVGVGSASISSSVGTSVLPRNEARPKKAHRLPEDWTPAAPLLEWAATKVPDVDLDIEGEKFVNHWVAKSGKDATKLDWPRTWRNWMLNAQQRIPAHLRSTGTKRNLSRDAAIEWVRGEWRAGRVRPIEDRTGLRYPQPDLPFDVKTDAEIEAFLVKSAQDWINANHDEIVRRLTVRAVA